MATPVNGITGGVATGLTDGSGNLTFSLNTKPTSTNDVMILTVYGAHAGTVSASSDSVAWGVKTFANDGGDGVFGSVLVKQATAGDISTGSITFTTSTVSTRVLYSVTIIPGYTFDVVADSGAMRQTAPTSGTSTNMDVTALTPNTNSDIFLAISVCGFASTSAVTFSTPLNYTNLANKADSNTDGSLYVHYRIKSSDSSSEQPATTPTYTGTLGSNIITGVIAFKPTNITQNISPTDTAAAITDQALAGYNVYKTITDTAAQLSDFYSIATTHNTAPDSGAHVTDAPTVAKTVHPSTTDSGSVVSDAPGLITTHRPQITDAADQIQDVIWVGKVFSFSIHTAWVGTPYGFGSGSIVPYQQ